MKTKLLLTTLLSFYFFLLSSQVPQGFNYQAVARGSDGKELINTSLDVQISILSDTAGFYGNTIGTGAYVWEEQQSITTNNIGLFSLVIGNLTATKIQGSAATFSAIDWVKTKLYVGIKIKYQGTWKTLGSAQLWSVPYSMVSGTISGPVKKLSVTGETTVMDEALFEVKNKTGQTVFAVYNEGVRVYVDNGIAKGSKGGFAIGGFGTEKSTSKSLFVVSTDSIRAYIAPGTGKGSKGGFAIGGFDPTKTATGEEYLRVTRDSTRVYVKNSVKGSKGGFAIGGFDPTKGDPPSNFMDMTPKNYFIGEGSGRHTIGLYNSFVGYQTGLNNTIGTRNVFLGYRSGYSNLDGLSNVFIGNNSGFLNTSGYSNVIIGDQSGYSNTTGYSNLFMGTNSGYSNTSGYFNIMLGENSGYTNTTGSSNIFMGWGSGRKNVNGTDNIFLGTNSGEYNIGNYSTGEGCNNVFIGPGSGNHNETGKMNIFLGEQAGLFNISGDMNIFQGYQTGFHNTTGNMNLFFGQWSGYTNETGNFNVFLGNMCGFNNKGGASNVFLGGSAGGSNTAGNSNVMIGTNSGWNNKTGSNNIIIGNSAGGTATDGTDNIYLGSNAGQFCNGSGNVVIGPGVHPNPADNNIFMVGNILASSSSYLIWGDFTNKKINLSADVGIGTETPSARLDVNGTVKIGTNGTAINKIIKIISTVDLGAIGGNSSIAQAFTVSNASLGSSVMISPSADLPDGIVIASARVSAAGTVTVSFRNTTGGALDPSNMSFYITVIE
jgi:hypothetical protein